MKYLRKINEEVENNLDQEDLNDILDLFQETADELFLSKISIDGRMYFNGDMYGTYGMRDRTSNKCGEKVSSVTINDPDKNSYCIYLYDDKSGYAAVDVFYKSPENGIQIRLNNWPPIHELEKFMIKLRSQGYKCDLFLQGSYADYYPPDYFRVLIYLDNMSESKEMSGYSKELGEEDVKDIMDIFQEYADEFLLDKIVPKVRHGDWFNSDAWYYNICSDLDRFVGRTYAIFGSFNFDSPVMIIIDIKWAEGLDLKFEDKLEEFTQRLKNIGYNASFIKMCPVNNGVYQNDTITDMDRYYRIKILENEIKPTLFSKTKKFLGIKEEFEEELSKEDLKDVIDIFTDFSDEFLLKKVEVHKWDSYLRDIEHAQLRDPIYGSNEWRNNRCRLYVTHSVDQMESNCETDRIYCVDQVLYGTRPNITIDIKYDFSKKDKISEFVNFKKKLKQCVDKIKTHGYNVKLIEQTHGYYRIKITEHNNWFNKYESIDPIKEAFQEKGYIFDKHYAQSRLGASSKYDTPFDIDKDEEVIIDFTQFSKGSEGDIVVGKYVETHLSGGVNNIKDNRGLRLSLDIPLNGKGLDYTIKLLTYINNYQNTNWQIFHIEYLYKSSIFSIMRDDVVLRVIFASSGDFVRQMNQYNENVDQSVERKYSEDDLQDIKMMLIELFDDEVIDSTNYDYHESPGHADDMGSQLTRRASIVDPFGVNKVENLPCWSLSFNKNCSLADLIRILEKIKLLDTRLGSIYAHIENVEMYKRIGGPVVKGDQYYKKSHKIMIPYFAQVWISVKFD